MPVGGGEELLRFIIRLIFEGREEAKKAAQAAKEVSDAEKKAAQETKKAAAEKAKAIQEATTRTRELGAAISHLSTLGGRSFTALALLIKGSLVAALTLGTAILAGFITKVVQGATALAEFAAKGQIARQAVNQLAMAWETTGDVLIQEVVRGMQGTISQMDAARIASAALAGGLDLTEGRAGKLAEGAFRLARLMGRDTKESFERLVMSILKTERRLLDELTIVIRLADAKEKLAQKSGKTADSLSAMEIQAAFASAVFEGLETRVKALGDVQLTTTDRMSQFRASVINLKEALGNALGPTIDAVLPSLVKFTEEVAKAQAPPSREKQLQELRGQIRYLESLERTEPFGGFFGLRHRQIQNLRAEEARILKEMEQERVTAQKAKEDREERERTEREDEEKLEAQDFAKTLRAKQRDIDIARAQRTLKDEAAAVKRIEIERDAAIEEMKANIKGAALEAQVVAKIKEEADEEIALTRQRFRERREREERQERERQEKEAEGFREKERVSDIRARIAKTDREIKDFNEAERKKTEIFKKAQAERLKAFQQAPPIQQVLQLLFDVDTRKMVSGMERARAGMNLLEQLTLELGLTLMGFSQRFRRFAFDIQGIIEGILQADPIKASFSFERLTGIFKRGIKGLGDLFGIGGKKPDPQWPVIIESATSALMRQIEVHMQLATAAEDAREAMGNFSRQIAQFSRQQIGERLQTLGDILASIQYFMGKPFLELPVPGTGKTVQELSPEERRAFFTEKIRPSLLTQIGAFPALAETARLARSLFGVDITTFEGFQALFDMARRLQKALGQGVGVPAAPPSGQLLAQMLAQRRLAGAPATPMEAPVSQVFRSVTTVSETTANLLVGVQNSILATLQHAIHDRLVEIRDGIYIQTDFLAKNWPGLPKDVAIAIETDTQRRNRSTGLSE